MKTSLAAQCLGQARNELMGACWRLGMAMKSILSVRSPQLGCLRERGIGRRHDDSREFMRLLRTLRMSRHESSASQGVPSGRQGRGSCVVWSAAWGLATTTRHRVLACGHGRGTPACSGRFGVPVRCTSGRGRTARLSNACPSPVDAGTCWPRSSRTSTRSRSYQRPAEAPPDTPDDRRGAARGPTPGRGGSGVSPAPDRFTTVAATASGHVPESEAVFRRVKAGARRPNGGVARLARCRLSRRAPASRLRAPPGRTVANPRCVRR